MAKLVARKRLKISRVIPVWVRIPLSAPFLLLGCSDLEGGPYSETHFGKWTWLTRDKCEHIIKGRIYRPTKTTFECWYGGKIVWQGEYIAP